MVEKRNKQSNVSPDFHNREKLLNQELSRYIYLLTKHGAPEKVILFGTLAEGRIHEWSDIDLVVIERTTLPFYQRLRNGIIRCLAPNYQVMSKAYQKKAPTIFHQTLHFELKTRMAPW